MKNQDDDNFTGPGPDPDPARARRIVEIQEDDGDELTRLRQRCLQDQSQFSWVPLLCSLLPARLVVNQILSFIVILDPFLISLLPRSLVEHNIVTFITHVFTSKEDLIRAVDAYVADPSTFCYRIGLWDVSAITDFSKVFDGERNQRLRRFNEDLTEWNMSNATDLSYMFNCCYAFNGDVSSWNISNVTNLSGMFYQCNYGDVSSWNISHARNVGAMFEGCGSFNGNVSSWNVANAGDLNSVFHGCGSFNGDVSSWNVANANNLSFLFYGCMSFNGDVSSWNVSNATNMISMFQGCFVFNRDVSSWNVANATHGGVSAMFDDCHSFNRHHVATWNLSIYDILSMFDVPFDE
eukprot:CAMPEP_0194037164 /NCGR_PEP_ID=MMETSP0009_2-20130614/9506_1 /TAXON_ID=210454 /ORGANISM="Grammatophora oceanica, Strain CCMP 410" /LENGTH=350 /DNA_ID=CAMNT_0038679211 /DNA_START=81 /DNA_END=1133 /DNA_ORIENTATION=+